MWIDRIFEIFLILTQNKVSLNASWQSVRSKKLDVTINAYIGLLLCSTFITCNYILQDETLKLLSFILSTKFMKV